MPCQVFCLYQINIKSNLIKINVLLKKQMNVKLSFNNSDVIGRLRSRSRKLMDAAQFENVMCCGGVCLARGEEAAGCR